jgi:hypothetical protein
VNEKDNNVRIISDERIAVCSINLSDDERSHSFYHCKGGYTALMWASEEGHKVNHGAHVVEKNSVRIHWLMILLI